MKQHFVGRELLTDVELVIGFELTDSADQRVLGILILDGKRLYRRVRHKL